MIYLFYGTEEFLINREIKNIAKDNNIEDIDISYYNLENDLLDNVLEDADMNSLFSTRKIMIVDNAYIFTGTVRKKGPNHNIELLIKYLTNPNPDTILIFTNNDESIDDRKKIVKNIKNSGTVREFNKLKSNDSFIKQELNDYKMSPTTIKAFSDYVGSNLAIISSEIEKLKLYKGDDKNITTDDVYMVCSELIDVDLNELTNNIVCKNMKKALKIYEELVKQGEEPIQIIIRLANQFRIIYQVKGLSKKGYSNKDITNILGIHPYRIQKALESSYQFSSQKLLEYLKKLSDIDEGIKMGTIDKNMALELFILEV